MASSINRELDLLRYSKVNPSAFEDIQLSEEIGESVSPDEIIRWDSGDSPVAFPATVIIGDKVRISNSTVSTNNGLFTITNITTTTVTNDTIEVTPDNLIDTIGSGTRTGGGVGNMVIFREANTSFGSSGNRFENIFCKTLDILNTLVIPDGSTTQTDAPPTVDEGIANKKYVDDQITAATLAPTLYFQEITGAPIVAGTPVSIPASGTYFGDAPASGATVTFGRYLIVRRNGQKLYAGDTGFERDYKETGVNATGQTQVTFEFDLEVGDYLEFEVARA